MVSSVQSSVLLVMPGSEGSKAEMPTPNILAEPSHLDKLIRLQSHKIKVTSSPEGPHVGAVRAGRPRWADVLEAEQLWRPVPEIFKLQLARGLGRRRPVGVPLCRGLADSEK